MNKPNEPLPVLFRKERSGEFKGAITALFPTLPFDYQGHLMTCYAQVGQHSGASWRWYRTTRPAKPEEYAALLAELKGIYECDLGGEGVFPLKVVHRIAAEHRIAFRADLQKINQHLKGGGA